MKEKGKLRWRLIAGLAVLAALVTFALTAGRILVVNSPQPSDLILVLAGETDHRPAHALELLHQGFGRRIMIDVPAEARIYEFAQLDLAEKYIHGLPESGSVTICPIHGLSTRDESHDVEKCIANQPVSRILIVTSDFHTRRALSIFRHELSGKTFSVAASRDAAQFGTRWWTHRQWAKTCADEWLRTLWWSAVERWQ